MEGCSDDLRDLLEVEKEKMRRDDGRVREGGELDEVRWRGFRLWRRGRSERRRGTPN